MAGVNNLVILNRETANLKRERARDCSGYVTRLFRTKPACHWQGRLQPFEVKTKKEGILLHLPFHVKRRSAPAAAFLLSAGRRYATGSLQFAR